MAGKFHGKGKFVWPDQTYYEGEYITGDMHGEGELQTVNFNYKGLFTKDKFHG